jgi:hypothetical protein
MTSLPLHDMQALRRAAAQLRDTQMPPQAYELVVGWIDPLITYIEHLKRGLEHARAGQIVSAVFAAADCPRPFALHRREDVTGASGTGTVAYGTRFSDGTVGLRWLGDKPSLVVWKSIDDALAVHGHDGRTDVVWLSEHFADLAEIEAALQRLAKAAEDVLAEAEAAAVDTAALVALRKAILAVPAAALPPPTDKTTGTAA